MKFFKWWKVALIVLALVGGNLVGYFVANRIYDTKESQPIVYIGEPRVEEILPDDVKESAPEEVSDWVRGEAELTMDGVPFAKKVLYFSPMATPRVRDTIAGWIVPVSDGWLYLPADEWKNSEVFMFIGLLAQEGKIVWDDALKKVYPPTSNEPPPPKPIFM
jgi:hypothetical protein